MPDFKYLGRARAAFEAELDGTVRDWQNNDSAKLRLTNISSSFLDMAILACNLTQEAARLNRDPNSEVASAASDMINTLFKNMTHLDEVFGGYVKTLAQDSSPQKQIEVIEASSTALTNFADTVKKDSAKVIRIHNALALKT